MAGRGRGGMPPGQVLPAGQSSETPAGQRRRENILDLAEHVDKELVIRFVGGREVRGVLKGFDQLMNLTLDSATETLKDKDGHTITDEDGRACKRNLGLLIVRSALLSTVAPAEGVRGIGNPFEIPDDGEDEAAGEDE